jgi:hypothetical protein
MREMRFFWTSVLVAFLGLGVVRGQYSGTSGLSSPGSAGTGSGVSAEEANPPVIGPTIFTHSSVSEWLINPRAPGCSGPVGHDGPISTEVFVQSGICVPFSGNYFGRTFGMGWDAEVGGKGHFFNPAMDADWVLGLSVSNEYNDAVDRKTPRILLDVPNRIASQLNALTPGTGPIGPNGLPTTLPTLTPVTVVTMRDYNRTYFNLFGGREWYIWGCGESDGHTCAWKWGIDGGGRYGTSKLEMLQLRHFTDRIGALFCALHSEMEIPYGPGLISFGLRTEWSYTWSDVLQRMNNADLMEVSILLTGGVRF